MGKPDPYCRLTFAFPINAINASASTTYAEIARAWSVWLDNTVPSNLRGDVWFRIDREQNTVHITVASVAAAGAVARFRDYELRGPGFHFSIGAPPNGLPPATRRRRRADALLDRLGSLIPRSHREAVLGDLREDVRDYRELGWTEKQIRRHIRWQFGIIVFERVKGVFRWAWFAWAFKAVKGWLAHG